MYAYFVMLEMAEPRNPHSGIYKFDHRHEQNYTLCILKINHEEKSKKVAWVNEFPGLDWRVHDVLFSQPL